MLPMLACFLVRSNASVAMPRRTTNVLPPRRSCTTEGIEWPAAARDETFSDRRPAPEPAPPDHAPRLDARDAHGWPPAGAAGRDAHRRGDRREIRRNIVPSGAKQGPLQNEASRQQTTCEPPSGDQGGVGRRPRRNGLHVDQLTSHEKICRDQLPYRTNVVDFMFLFTPD